MQLEGYISNLDELLENPEMYNKPIEPGVEDFTWQVVAPVSVGLTRAGLNPVSNITTAIQEAAPFLNDVWRGKDVFMASLLGNNKNIREKGSEYLKNYLVNNPINTKHGVIEFRNKVVNETLPENLWQLPFARYNLFKAQKNIKMPNKKPDKRTDADVFDNIEVKSFGKKYDYQIRNNNNDKSKDLYNIKDYKFFEKDLEEIKNDPVLYQKFINLNNKGL